MNFSMNKALVRQVIFFGKPVSLFCDGKCHKAWGINNRPRKQLSKDVDDYEYLADSELKDAPINPGIYEGGEAKPTKAAERLNKWCARECERSVLVSQEKGTMTLPDFSKRIKNKVPK